MTALFDQTWFELREPGKVPVLKGPWPRHLVKQNLIEFMEARPRAFITVLQVTESGPLISDGPEYLLSFDLRMRRRPRRHIKSTRAAFAAAGAK
jgi:hypothetical protein